MRVEKFTKLVFAKYYRKLLNIINLEENGCFWRRD
jgi:hypothetical protein